MMYLLGLWIAFGIGIWWYPTCYLRVMLGRTIFVLPFCILFSPLIVFWLCIITLFEIREGNK